jgi:hypothetical protein
VGAKARIVRIRLRKHPVRGKFRTAEKIPVILFQFLIPPLSRKGDTGGFLIREHYLLPREVLTTAALNAVSPHVTSETQSAFAYLKIQKHQYHEILKNFTLV